MTGSLSAFTPFCGTDSDMVGAAVKVFWGGGGTKVLYHARLGSLLSAVSPFSAAQRALSFSRERADVLRAPGGTLAAELTEPATYNRVSYFGLARLRRHGLSMLAEQ